VFPGALARSTARACVEIFAVAGMLSALPFPAFADPAPPEHMDVSCQPIRQFLIGSDEVRFGPLEFVGGMTMTGSGWAFGSFSSIRFLEPGATFIGVTDTGYWYTGRVERDADGRPDCLGDFSMQAIVDRQGNALGDKVLSDAEGIEVGNDTVTASFERDHRISEFALQPGAMSGPVHDLDFLVPRHELRRNRGFETIARAPVDGPLAGARVAITEKSIDSGGNIFAAILEGPLKGVFKVVRSEEFDITDGAFLPGGDLLILERRFSFSAGVAMRLRRLEAATIRPGALADGPVLLEAGMSYDIDNMEGLDVWRRGDGALIVSLISDDNGSILQRNVYLEFRLGKE